MPPRFSFTQRASCSSRAISLPRRSRASLIWSRRRAFLSFSHSSANCLPTRTPRWPVGIRSPSFTSARGKARKKASGSVPTYRMKVNAFSMATGATRFSRNSRAP